MSTETDLARLTAGLDRDAEIARAAGERATEWRSDGKGVAGGPFTPADPEWEITEQGTHTIVYDEGWPLAPEALHIATFDPARVLSRVEALRMVMEVLTAGGCSWCDDDARKDFEPVLRALAAIYEEQS